MQIKCFDKTPLKVLFLMSKVDYIGGVAFNILWSLYTWLIAILLLSYLAIFTIITLVLHKTSILVYLHFQNFMSCLYVTMSKNYRLRLSQFLSCAKLLCNLSIFVNFLKNCVN